jgi:UTP-glucose-1-phosphate uridylyltransferase
MSSTRGAGHPPAGAHAKHRLAVVALMEVPPETHLYGIAAGEPIDEETVRITHVGKPKGTAPSNLAVIGGACCAEVFDILARQPGVGERSVTDARQRCAAAS